MWTRTSTCGRKMETAAGSHSPFVDGAETRAHTSRKRVHEQVTGEKLVARRSKRVSFLTLCGFRPTWRRVDRLRETPDEAEATRLPLC